MGGGSLKWGPPLVKRDLDYRFLPDLKWVCRGLSGFVLHVKWVCPSEGNDQIAKIF